MNLLMCNFCRVRYATKDCFQFGTRNFVFDIISDVGTHIVETFGVERLYDYCGVVCNFLLSGYGIKLGTSSLELGTSCSELGTSSLELGTSCSELGTSCSELGTSCSELGTSSLELGTSCSELETSCSELETWCSELGTSSFLGRSTDADFSDRYSTQLLNCKKA